MFRHILDVGCLPTTDPDDKHSGVAKVADRIRKEVDVMEIDRSMLKATPSEKISHIPHDPFPWPGNAIQNLLPR